MESLRIHFEKYFMKKRSIYIHIWGKLIPIYGTKSNLYFIITVKFLLVKIWRLELYYILHKQSMGYGVFFAYFLLILRDQLYQHGQVMLPHPPKLNSKKYLFPFVLKQILKVKLFFFGDLKDTHHAKKLPKEYGSTPSYFCYI